MKRTSIIVAVLLIVGLLLYFGFQYFSGNLIGGGGSQQYAPDTVQAGESAEVTLIVTATGGGGNIQGRFTDVSLHYRLVGETEYGVVQPQSIPLPDNFKTVQSKTFQSEAYEFTIPPYPQGTSGEIEYYIELTFDDYQSRQEGAKKIIVVPNSTGTKNTFNYSTSTINIASHDAPSSSTGDTQESNLFPVPLECGNEVYEQYMGRYAYTPKAYFDAKYSQREKEILKDWVNAVDCSKNINGEHAFVAINLRTGKIYPYAIRRDTVFYYTQVPFIGAVIYEGLPEPILVQEVVTYEGVSRYALVDPNTPSLSLNGYAQSAKYTVIESGEEIEFYGQKIMVYGVITLDDGLVAETNTGIMVLSPDGQKTRAVVNFKTQERAGYYYTQSIDGSTVYYSSLKKGAEKNTFLYSLYSVGYTEDDAVAYPDFPPQSNELQARLN